MNDHEYNEKKQRELNDRVSEELKNHEGKNFLEKYALYMLRVQMYEISLKQDLHLLYNLEEEKSDRMNLNSILRFFKEKDINCHPILLVNIEDIATQRNQMAHEFLAILHSSISIAEEQCINLFEKDMNRFIFELEIAFQQYLMLKETGMLYQDNGAP